MIPTSQCSWTLIYCRKIAAKGKGLLRLLHGKIRFVYKVYCIAQDIQKMPLKMLWRRTTAKRMLAKQGQKMTSNSLLNMWCLHWCTFCLLVGFVLFFFLTAVHNMHDLSSQPGTETVSPEVETRSPNHWAAREVPALKCFEGWCSAGWNSFRENLLGKKDICKGPGVRMSLASREMKG